MGSVIRGAGVLLASIIVGIVVASVGGQLLPTSPEPTQAVLDASSGKPFDMVLAQEWLEANRRPGRLLVWVCLPIAAAAVGATAGFLSRDAWWLVAPAAVLCLMAMLNSGSPVDLRVVQLTLAYSAIAWFVAWGTNKRRSSVGAG